MGEKGYLDGLLEAQLSGHREVLVDFIEEARTGPRRGLYIVYLPALEHTVAAGILASSLESSGIRAVLTPSLGPPEELSRIPSIYVGIDPPGRGEELYLGPRRGKHRVSREITVDSGLPSLVALLLDGVAPLSTSARLAALASALASGRDVGEKRGLTGLDREAARRTEGLDTSFSLLLYGLASRPLAAALARTILPYYPGATGSEDEARRMLGEQGIPGGSLYKELREEQITALIKLLVDVVSRKYPRKPRNPRSIIAGTTYQYPGPRGALDLRELGEILEAAHYAWGPTQPLLYIMIGAAERLRAEYEARLLRRVVELVERARSSPGVLRDVRVAGRKAWIHGEASIGDPLSVVAKVLRLLGVLDEGQPLLSGSPAAAPLDELLRAGAWPLPQECLEEQELRGAWVRIGEHCLEG